jgi:hypothetical protein
MQHNEDVKFRTRDNNISLILHKVSKPHTKWDITCLFVNLISDVVAFKEVGGGGCWKAVCQRFFVAEVSEKLSASIFRVKPIKNKVLTL